jgi:L-ascorbate metabolism protein UlaG (beta-lactamase superfamily)
MKTWLEFETNEDAKIALQQIDNNKGLPNNNAVTWAYIFQTINNTYVFTKPDDEFMFGLGYYNEIDIDFALLPVQDEELN